MTETIIYSLGDLGSVKEDIGETGMNQVKTNIKKLFFPSEIR